MNQRTVALNRANEVRLEAARLKKSIKDGTVSLDHAVLTTEIEHVTVAKLLTSARWISDRRAEEFLEPLRIRPDRPIVHLTERQRKELAEAVVERFPWTVNR